MDREQVIGLLAQAEGYLSGEEMSRALGVTRAAVWKEIAALREQGWPIDSAPRQGYRLSGEAPTLSSAYLTALLEKDSLFSGRVSVLEQVDSTNTRLKTLAA
jgi:BirA family biotin operon repressor/biotin-[acetyl-CoA-carboxylase] ligase